MRESRRLPESELDIMLVVWKEVQRAAQLSEATGGKGLSDLRQKWKSKYLYGFDLPGGLPEKRGEEHPPQALRGFPDPVCRRPL